MCMMQSPKHCKMATPVADDSLPLEPNQSKKRRFAHLSEEERNVKKNNVNPGNTIYITNIYIYNRTTQYFLSFVNLIGNKIT